LARKGGTPDDIDYLFERDIIDEEDYAEFWSEYWRLDKVGRDLLVSEFIERAGEERDEEDEAPISGTVVNSKLAAARQINAFSKLTHQKYVIVRRDKRGRFSKRGRRFQAVRRK
jgi:hypothetical protein